MSNSKATQKNRQIPDIGSVVHCVYKDHVIFRDSDAMHYQPWVRECIGWLDYQDEEYIRIVWERFAVPSPPEEAKPRATGLVILKKTILEIRKVA